MNDRALKKMEGRWFLQYSGCPLWKRGNTDTISFNYELIYRGEELVLKEQVEFRKNGKMKMKRGYEVPTEGSDILEWRGVGMNRLFRNRSKVLYNDEGILIMWFEKTISTPESLDVLTKKKHLSAGESTYIFSLLENIEGSEKYMEELESVNIL